MCIMEVQNRFTNYISIRLTNNNNNYTVMKFLQRFFELLIRYQQAKYELKCHFEKMKCELGIWYMEKQKDLHTK